MSGPVYLGASTAVLGPSIAVGYVGSGRICVSALKMELATAAAP